MNNDEALFLDRSIMLTMFEDFEDAICASKITIKPTATTVLDFWRVLMRGSVLVFTSTKEGQYLVFSACLSIKREELGL